MISMYEGPVKLVHEDRSADAWGHLWIEVDEPIDATELERQDRMSWRGALAGDADWAKLVIESMGYEVAIEIPDGRTGRMVLTHFQSAAPGAYGSLDTASGYGVDVPPWLKALMLPGGQSIAEVEATASKESTA